jgi:hypothetical protein
MDEYNFYKYIDNKSILVITSKNKLIRIRCPFAVMNSENKVLQVDAVTTISNSIYFKIKGIDYKHSAFLIYI